MTRKSGEKRANLILTNFLTFFFPLYFKTGSHSAAQVDRELMVILLPRTPKHWHHRCDATIISLNILQYCIGDLKGGRRKTESERKYKHAERTNVLLIFTTTTKDLPEIVAKVFRLGKKTNKKDI